ncbi:hypothetical protein IJG20_00185 [Candidatus Saccharibacteria bacterium]|nr:hypothetical protein [Candidatus Saccharibacteria bacterium]
MRIYISGISGTAMGPLALMAKEAGFEVLGSDLAEGAVTEELRKAKINIFIGKQNGDFLAKEYEKKKLDWFVYTSALPKDHAELMLAKKLKMKVSKRDEFIAFLVKKLGLKMIAVAGTHGKTTTTAGIVFLSSKLGLPVSWLVGTTLGFEEAGKYVPGSKFLIYEADEYDRNFLYYHPFLSIIPSVSYDHPDIYPTEEDYKAAFAQFIRQSQKTITKTNLDKKLSVAGKVRRFDLGLGVEAVQEMIKELGLKGDKYSQNNLLKIMNDFPGVGRRMEKITDGVYSDYAHHPEEIIATVEIAKEEAKRLGLKGVVVVYEPHQNVRQHEVFPGYTKAFLGVEKLFWTPTYLTREDPSLKILKPEDFISNLENFEVGEPAVFDESLYLKLKNYREKGFLIILMTAGPGDRWLREHFSV